MPPSSIILALSVLVGQGLAKGGSCRDGVLYCGHTLNNRGANPNPEHATGDSEDSEVTDMGSVPAGTDGKQLSAAGSAFRHWSEIETGICYATSCYGYPTVFRRQLECEDVSVSRRYGRGLVASKCPQVLFERFL
ncbi:hypothetical protein V8F33_011636 [Rhypophila sp. PSN 637]